MMDLRGAFRAELDELDDLEGEAAPIPTSSLVERVERTLEGRRRARTIQRGAFALAAAALVVMGIGARRSSVVAVTSEIAREPVPSQPVSLPVSPSAAASADEATSAAAAPARSEAHAPHGPDRTAPSTPPLHAKPSAGRGADELLERALSARASGDLDASADQLVSLRRAHPGTSQAAIAAAYLGRDAARSGQRDAARRWFETYLAEQPSGPLAREASGQLIELTTGAEQMERARAYLAQHPNGPHAPLATRVLAGAR